MSLPARRAPNEFAPTVALMGRIEELSLFDIGQFLMLNRKTGTLTARSEQQCVYLTFKEGQLLNAVDENLQNGEKVLLAAVQWQFGTFEFDAGPVSPVRRIQDSTESVLLEAARLLDEMQAEEQIKAEEGGGPANSSDTPAPSSHLAKFQEAQERAEALSEVFRNAVAADAESSLGTTWKETLLKSLANGEIERLFIGPGHRIRVVTQDRVQTVEVPSPEDVLAWASSLVPIPENWGDVQGQILERKPSKDSLASDPESDHSNLWVTRSQSPEGDWFVITQPWSRFPTWKDLGFGEELANKIEEIDGKAILLSAPSPQLARVAIAAWLARRADLVPSSGLVVESTPSYDWTQLAGRVDSVAPQRFGRPGDLLRMRDLTGARLLVLNGVREGWLLAEGLSLAAEGTRVVVSVPGASVNQSVQRLDEWLNAFGSLRSEINPGTKLAAAWQIGPSSTPGGPPLQSRLVLQRDAAKDAA